MEAVEEEVLAGGVPRDVEPARPRSFTSWLGRDAGPARDFWYLRPDAGQAWHAHRHAGGWIADVLESGATHVVIDLAEAERIDFSGFGVILQRLHAAGIAVRLINTAPHLAVSLRQLGLLHGATVQERPRPPRRAHRGAAATAPMPVPDRRTGTPLAAAA